MKEVVNQFIEYWPFLVPMLVIQVTLVLVALIHIFRHNTYRIGNRTLWVVIVVVFQLLGSIVYLTVGREQE